MPPPRASRFLMEHRLALMTLAFVLGIASAALSERGEAIRQPVWMFFEHGREAVLVVSALGCLLAFLIRVEAEARMGMTVWNQGKVDALVETGPYRLVRNPLYTGTWLFFSSALMLWAPALVWLVLSAAFGLMLHLIVLHEEHIVGEQAGERYRRFVAEVPRWFPRWPRDVEETPIPVRARLSGALANLGLLSLAMYRLGLVLGGPVKVLGALNLTLIVVWLVVVGRRRWSGLHTRGSDPRA